MLIIAQLLYLISISAYLYTNIIKIRLSGHIQCSINRTNNMAVKQHPRSLLSLRHLHQRFIKKLYVGMGFDVAMF